MVAPALDPVDMLLHVAVYALLEGMSSLRHFADLDQLLRHDGAAGDEVLRRTAQSGRITDVAALRRTLDGADAASLTTTPQPSRWRRTAAS